MKGNLFIKYNHFIKFILSKIINLIYTLVIYIYIIYKYIQYICYIFRRLIFEPRKQKSRVALHYPALFLYYFLTVQFPSGTGLELLIKFSAPLPHIYTSAKTFPAIV